MVAVKEFGYIPVLLGRFTKGNNFVTYDLLTLPKLDLILEFAFKEQVLFFQC